MPSSRRRSRVASRTFAALFAVALLTGYAAFALLPQAFEPWNLRATDLLFVLREATGLGTSDVDPKIALVDIDDRTEDALDTRRVGRRHFARVITGLREAGAAVQVHDSVWRRPGASADERAEDRELIEAVRGSSSVLAGLVARLDAPPRAATERFDQAWTLRVDTTWTLRVEGDSSRIPVARDVISNFDELASALRGQGFLDVTADRDGVYRRAPLLARVDGTEDRFVPSLPLLAACVRLGVKPENILLRPGRELMLGDRAVPIDKRASVRVDFVPWAAWTHYAFHDIHDAARMRGGMLAYEALTDAVVVVADISTVANDAGPSPLDANDPLPGLHASVIHSIVNGRFVREVDTVYSLLLEALLLAVLLVLARRASTTGLLIGGLCLCVAYVVATAGVFLAFGWILHVVRPLVVVALALGAAIAVRYLAEERARAAVQSSFEAFFPPDVVRELTRDPERVRVGGQRKELTILFSDVEGFTSASASMEPDEVHDLLNRYFAVMVDVVFEHGGTLDKFIGDGLMVFFGDPEPQADHALRCVRCAIEMQRRLVDLNAKFAEEGKSPIRVRIGIHTGPVIVGNMGSPKRLSYTVLGSTVNLAARLEPRAPVGGILISTQTYEAVRHEIAADALEAIEVKGFEAPVQIYRVHA